MLNLIFILLVVAGFAGHFLSTFPVPNASRWAWGLWLIASFIWAFTQSGARVG